MPALRLSGDPAYLAALQAELSAAGFVAAEDAAIFLHVGAAADCPEKGTGLLVANAIGPEELSLLATGTTDVVARCATKAELVARLQLLVRRASTDELLRQAADLADYLQDGVVVVDYHGRILMMNQAAMGALGCPEAPLGALLLEVARPADPGRREELIRLVRQGKRLINEDVEFVLRDGRKATLAVSSGPLQVGSHGGVISFRDVTSARQIEAELRRTRDFLHHLVEGSSDAIIASDMRGRLVVFNAAAERLFGVPASQARSRLNVIDLYPEGGAREMMRMLRDAPNNHVEAVRAYGQTRQGELVPIEVSASLVKMNGAEVATVGLLRDLRERVRVEAELARTRAKLIDAEKQSAITALAGATAHELNQPLTVILGYIDLLRRKADDSQRKPIDAIAQHADRMAEIVRRIAKLTHVEVMPYPGKLQIADLEAAPEGASTSGPPRR